MTLLSEELEMTKGRQQCHGHFSDFVACWQVCARVQLDNDCNADSLLTALRSALAPDNPLPHRTAAAAALAVLARLPANAASVAQWLGCAASCASRDIEGAKYSEGGSGARKANGSAERPETAAAA